MIESEPTTVLGIRLLVTDMDKLTERAFGKGYESPAMYIKDVILKSLSNDNKPGNDLAPVVVS